MDDPCLALEGAYLSRQGIEVVEAAVVRVGRYGTNTAHSIQIPWGEYERETSTSPLCSPIIA